MVQHWPPIILAAVCAILSAALCLHLHPALLPSAMTSTSPSPSPPYSAAEYAQLTSWMPVPNGSDFPIQNLPFGVFTTDSQPQKHIGVAIGDHVLDLYVLAEAGLFPSASLHRGDVFKHPSLNAFLALERPQWLEARHLLTSLLSSSTPTLRDDSALRARALLPLSSVHLHLPFLIGDYTDFYASRHHAFNIGSMWRGPANALQPNYLHLPVGYHGRASSVVLSGEPIHRPRGQTLAEGASSPALTPCRVLDFELEVGLVVGGRANRLGHPLSMARAAERAFGLVLLNDWSARDVQKWEYVPLGPFTAKNFASSISPWVVTFDALQPFQVAPPTQEPPPLAYLQAESNLHFDVGLTVHLQPPDQATPTLLSRTSTRHLYWTFQQMLTHHAVTGCNMQAGDLLGSGTISGEDDTAYGSMIEMSWGGQKEVKLQGGDTRKSLKDGDEVVLRGRAKKEGVGYEIGFGECRGRILPVVEDKDWE